MFLFNSAGKYRTGHLESSNLMVKSSALLRTLRAGRICISSLFSALSCIIMAIDRARALHQIIRSGIPQILLRRNGRRRGISSISGPLTWIVKHQLGIPCGVLPISGRVCQPVRLSTSEKPHNLIDSRHFNIVG